MNREIIEIAPLAYMRGGLLITLLSLWMKARIQLQNK